MGVSSCTGPMDNKESQTVMLGSGVGELMGSQIDSSTFTVDVG